MGCVAADADREHVGRGAVENAVRGGTEQQCKPVATVAADHDEVDGLFFCNTMNFCFGTSEDEVSMIGRHADRRCEFGKMGFGLGMDLFLYGRQVHRNVSAVCETQWFDDVDDVQFGADAFCNGEGPGCNALRLFGQVYRQQDPSVCAHDCPPAEVRATIQHNRRDEQPDAPRRHRSKALIWLIIGVILLAAFGPIFWMLPSAADRRLAKMRGRARTLGIHVEITQLDDLVAEPHARVTAGGVRREPKVSCAAYRMGLPRMARAAPKWMILRMPGADDGPIPGWQWDVASGRAMPSGDADYWKRVADLTSAFPPDTLALAAGPSEVACWWRERTTAQDAEKDVDRLHETLQKLAEIQRVADASASAGDADEEAPEPSRTRH